MNRAPSVPPKSLSLNPFAEHRIDTAADGGGGGDDSDKGRKEGTPPGGAASGSVGLPERKNAN